MQVINKGQSNKFVVTLKEKQTLTNPYFLFEFTNKVERNPIYVILTDVSGFPDRFNQFNIVEGTTVNLTEEGEWDYRVFEQLSNSNLNPSLSDNKVPLEVGMLYVKGTPTITKKQYVKTQTIKTYGAGV
jgi:hypothetical protein